MPCQDLACELIKHNLDINVMIGGGQMNFYPDTEPLPVNSSVKGARLDKQNLVQYWQDQQKSKNRNYCFFGSPASMAGCDFNTADYVLGKTDG